MRMNWKMIIIGGLAFWLVTDIVGIEVTGGIIALPMKIVIWWGVDGMILFVLGGTAMGWAGERFAE